MMSQNILSNICSKITAKRATLLLPIVWIGIIWLSDNQKYHYIPISVGLSCFAIFVNFPAILLGLHARPLYYDDLMIKGQPIEPNIYDLEFQGRYQRIFRYLVTFTASLFSIIIFEVFMSRIIPLFHDFDTDALITLLVTLGGIFRIYYTIQYNAGKVLLKILEKQKAINQRRQQRAQREELLMNINQIGISINSVPSSENLSIYDIRPDAKLVVHDVLHN